MVVYDINRAVIIQAATLAIPISKSLLITQRGDPKPYPTLSISYLNQVTAINVWHRVINNKYLILYQRNITEQHYSQFQEAKYILENISTLLSKLILY